MGADDGGANWSLSASLPAEGSILFEPMGRQVHDRANRDFIVLHKDQPGFTPGQIAEFRQTIDAAAGIVPPVAGAPAGIAELLAALKAKELHTLIIHGCNPVYSLPTTAGFR